MKRARTVESARPEVYDFDNDRGYTKRAAWKKTKAAYGPEQGVRWLLLALEEHAQINQGCPRAYLATAIHFFLQMTREEQRQADRSRFDWWMAETEIRKSGYEVRLITDHASSSETADIGDHQKDQLGSSDRRWWARKSATEMEAAHAAQ